MEGIGLVIVVAVIYFIPTFVAWNKPNNGGIIILNIFLGWSILGWIAALIWAVQAKSR